jgi:hypothetical protein
MAAQVRRGYRQQRLVALVAAAGGAALIAMAVAACGDDLVPRTDDCGAGTVLDGDSCVPADMPDCGDGTVYDQVSRECVLSADICASGTVLVEGRCQEPAGITPDLEEAAEPNDTGGLAGQIPVPAVGDGLVVHGCIDPYDGNPPLAQDGSQLMPDVDSWTIEVSEPTLLDVTSDGVGGLSAGFLVLPSDPALQRDFWSREAFSTAGDLVQRQLFLPRAGEYEISMWDSRSLLARLMIVPLPLGAGGPGACYYATVRRLPMPEAVPLPVGDAVDATLSTGPQVYRFDPAEAELLQVVAETPLDSSRSSVGTTLLVDGAYVASSFDSPILGPARLLSGFADGEQALVVVDAVFDYSAAATPSTFHMTSERFEPVTLTLGTPVTLTNPGGSAPTAIGDYHILRFDVPAGDVVFTDLDFSVPTTGDIYDGRTFYAADGTAGLPATSVRSSIRYAEAGRHYLFLFTPDAQPGSTVDVTAQLTPLAPPPLALAAPVANAPLGPRGEAWYTLDLTDELWLQLDGAGRDLGGDPLQLELFDPAGYGTVYSGLYASYIVSLDGTTHGQFFPDPTTHRPWLVRLSDPFPPADPAASYDVEVSRRDYSDLGAIATGAPIAAADQVLPAGGAVRYFVRGAPGQRVTVTVTPTGFDARVRSLGGDEFGFDTDEGGVGAPEQFVSDLFDTGLWIAFDVQGDAAGSFDVDVTSVAIPAYTSSSGAIRFADACGGGAEVPLMPGAFGGGDPTDEGLSAQIPMPFAFRLFGNPVALLTLSSNGWISTQDFPLDTTNPENNPLLQFDNVNGAIAPYWDDLQGVRICMLAEPDLLVVQWDGWLAASPTRLVQFQARLHSSGAIDFVYGPRHMGDGASATVGAENIEVTSAAQVVFDQRGKVRPESSISLSPVE